MKFSLVTTCYNEIDSVYHWINDIKNQTVAPDEIVIVDSGSKDGTLEVIQQWALQDKRIRIIVKKSTPAQGRNLAIRNTTHENIVSTDMGCRLESTWFQYIIEPFFRDESIEVVAGIFTIDKSKTTSFAGWADYVSGGNQPVVMIGGSLIPSNRSVAYKKKIWEQMNGYPEDITFAGDDVVFGIQLHLSNIKIYLEERAICYWIRPQRLSQLWNESKRYGFAAGETNYLDRKLADQVMKPEFFIYFHYAYIKSLIIEMPRFIREIIKIRKPLVCFILPILIYGNMTYYWKEYKAGLLQGNITALECRKRINRNICSKG